MVYFLTASLNYCNIILCECNKLEIEEYKNMNLNCNFLHKGMYAYASAHTSTQACEKSMHTKIERRFYGKEPDVSIS